MDGEIEARLAAAAEAMREHDLTVGRRDELQARAVELEGQLATMRARHDREQRDVEKLERLSLTRVLASLRGSREGDLDRERAEAKAAGYRLAEAQAQLEAVQRELAAAHARLGELAHAPASFVAVLDEKEEHLLQSQDALTARLLELAEERGRLTAQVREVGEAKVAAQRAAQALAEVSEKLGSASGWSTYDTFFGGGAISSAVKHSRIDDAAQAAAHADACLLALRTELADVGDIGVTAPRLVVDGLTRFVDVFFDNIFTDLAVREQIKQAQQNVDRSGHMVDQVGSRLEEREVADRARLADIAQERRTLLTQT